MTFTKPSKKHQMGAALLIVYIAAVVLANYVTHRYHSVPVGFGLTATAGTWAISGVIMTRDLLQDTLGRIVVLAAIIVGAAASWVVAGHQLAVASGVTFLIAESLEFAVYTPMRRRVKIGTGKWSGVVVVANYTGALFDTLLFLWLAGFPLTARGIGGQLLGKAWVTAAVVFLAVVVRTIAAAEAPEAIPEPAS